MGVFPITEFENLRAKYANPMTTEEKILKMKLDEIDKYYNECSPEESLFTDEIIRAFCNFIEKLEEAHIIECNILETRIEELDTGVGGTTLEPIPYEDGDELLFDFYRSFAQTHKQSTINDYVARIKTFTNRYIHTIPRVWEMYRRESCEKKVDIVLFTYRNLELIIACFDTKNDMGETDKQKNNIRSALKKLNEFKRARER